MIRRYANARNYRKDVTGGRIEMPFGNFYGDLHCWIGPGARTPTPQSPPRERRLESGRGRSSMERPLLQFSERDPVWPLFLMSRRHRVWLIIC